MTPQQCHRGCGFAQNKSKTVKTFKVSSTKTAKIKASANGTGKEATLTVKS